MKKLFITLSILSCVLIRCVAQTKIQEGEIKAKHSSYSIKKSTMDFGKGHPYHIFSLKNKYNYGISIPRPSNGTLPIRKSDFHVNEEQIKTIIYDVLGSRAQELHNHNETLDVWFIFETTGELTDTYFTLQENTIITTKEIDAIDARLRSEVKASFTGKSYQNYKAVEYTYFRPIVF